MVRLIKFESNIINARIDQKSLQKKNNFREDLYNIVEFFAVI